MTWRDPGGRDYGGHVVGDRDRGARFADTRSRLPFVSFSADRGTVAGEWLLSLAKGNDAGPFCRVSGSPRADEGLRGRCDSMLAAYLRIIGSIGGLTGRPVGPPLDGMRRPPGGSGALGVLYWTKDGTARFDLVERPTRDYQRAERAAVPRSSTPGRRALPPIAPGTGDSVQALG